MNASVASAKLIATHSPIRVSQHRTMSPGEGDNVGYLVAWQFSRPGYHEGEFTAPRADVQALFEQHGFAGALDARRADPVDALKTAASRGTKGAGIMVEPMPLKGKDAPLVIGVYFQVPRANEVGDEWVLGARVRVESVWQQHAPEPVVTCVAREPEEAVAPGDEHRLGRKRCLEVAQDIARRAVILMGNTQNTELSCAILEAGATCYWASFRKAGGVYWIPASDRAERFRALLLGLESFGHFWPTVQPLFGDADGLTLRNVGAAAEAALLGEIETLVAELDKAEGGKTMREATVTARRVRCQELVVQAEVYRNVLAGKVDQLGGALKTVHARYGALIGQLGNDSAFEGFGL